MSKVLKVAGEITGISSVARQGARIKRAGATLAKNVSELRDAARNAPPQFKRPTSGRGHNLESALSTAPPLVAMGILLLCVGALIFSNAPFVGPYLGGLVLLSGLWCLVLAVTFVAGWWQTRHRENGSEED